MEVQPLDESSHFSLPGWRERKYAKAGPAARRKLRLIEPVPFPLTALELLLITET